MNTRRVAAVPGTDRGPPKIKEPKLRPCGLCGRFFPENWLTNHHCVPKERGGTREDVALICGQCHSMIHATFTNRTLAQRFPTIELLRKAPELQAFIRWVRKQPTTRRTRNEPRTRKL